MRQLGGGGEAGIGKGPENLPGEEISPRPQSATQGRTGPLETPNEKEDQKEKQKYENGGERQRDDGVKKRFQK